jgi:hypothetical protein
MGSASSFFCVGVWGANNLFGLLGPVDVDAFCPQNLPQLRPVLIYEHQSRHCKLVLLSVSEPQYYEFALIIQILISKRQHALANDRLVSE